jgi:peptidoglycan/LPS O-acetylase OafA/YrhL
VTAGKLEAVNSQSESPNLDFLRSAAVGAVLFDHISRQLGVPKYGAIGRAGVLLFFVHTALVLMFSLERLSRSGGNVTARFYIQRFFRIYPLCWTCVAVVIAFHIPPRHVGAQYVWGGWGWLIRNLLLIQNFTFTSFVSGPMWSLPYEVQMYIVLPFVYCVACRRYALKGIALLWVAAAVVSMMLNRYYISTRGLQYDDSLHSPATYFVPCFLGGVVAFILSKRPHSVHSFWLLPPAILSFILLIYYFPFRHADWIGCTAMGTLLPWVSELRADIFVRIFHNIAKYSYGIYLSHTPLLWLTFTGFHGIIPDFLRWIVFSVLLAAVSVACYRYIEKPMIDVGRRLARTKAPAAVLKAAV